MVIVEPEERVVRHYRRTSWLSSVPLLAFVVMAYVAFASGGADFALTRFTVAMPSGGEWQISLGDMMLAFSLFVLFFEILKSTRTGGNSVVDHALSMIVFVVCLILFLIWPPAGTSLFFLIMLTTLIDVIAGFSVTIRSARRDYSVGSDTLELHTRFAKKGPGDAPRGSLRQERELTFSSSRRLHRSRRYRRRHSLDRKSR